MHWVSLTARFNIIKVTSKARWTGSPPPRATCTGIFRREIRNYLHLLYGWMCLSQHPYHKGQGFVFCFVVHLFLWYSFLIYCLSPFIKYYQGFRLQYMGEIIYFNWQSNTKLGQYHHSNLPRTSWRNESRDWSLILPFHQWLALQYIVLETIGKQNWSPFLGF